MSGETENDMDENTEIMARQARMDAALSDDEKRRRAIADDVRQSADRILIRSIIARRKRNVVVKP